MKLKHFVGILFALVVVSGIAYVGVQIFGSRGLLKEGIGTFSEGMRTGYVPKLSRKGTTVKTYEGQMILGFVPQGIFPMEVNQNGQPQTLPNGGAGVAVWSFSVNGDAHPEVVSTIQEEGIKKGKRLVFHYRSTRITGAGMDTDILVEKVEVAPEELR